MWDKPTDLYRHYDADELLLYVGISLDAFSRLRQHQSATGWTSKAVTMRTVTYPSRTEALEAEARAIAEENPLWNIAGVPRPADERYDGEAPVPTYRSAAHRRVILKQSRQFQKLTDAMTPKQWNAMIDEFARIRGDVGAYRRPDGRLSFSNGIERKFVRWIRAHFAAAHGFPELAEHSSGRDVPGRLHVEPAPAPTQEKEEPPTQHYAPAWAAWASSVAPARTHSESPTPARL
jgi:hypothetical protein